MKKLLLTILLFPLIVSAATTTTAVPWQRTVVNSAATGTTTPLFNLDEVMANFFRATSTTASSTFSGGLNLGGALRLDGLLSCSGTSVLETNALGYVTCGSDASGAGGSGIADYDAFTHVVAGTSATSTEMRFQSGFLSYASSTLMGTIKVGSLTATSAPIFSSLTGVLKGNGASVLTVAANGTDFTLITGTTCGGTDKVSAITAGGAITCAADETGEAGSNVDNLIYSLVGGTKYYTASSTATDNLSFRFNNGFVSNASSTVASQLNVSGVLNASSTGLFGTGLTVYSGNSVLAGGATITCTGCLTDVNVADIALGSGTSGNYVLSIADAGNSTITVANGVAEGGAVTLDAVDLNCTNCIGATEISDVYLLNNADDTTTGVLTAASGFIGQASSTFTGITNIGLATTTNLFSTGSSTVGGVLNVSGTATSTFAGGISGTGLFLNNNLELQATANGNIMNFLENTGGEYSYATVDSDGDLNFKTSDDIYRLKISNNYDDLVAGNIAVSGICALNSDTGGVSNTSCVDFGSTGMTFSLANNEILLLNSSGQDSVNVNGNSGDVDLIVEGLGTTNLLIADAGLNRVGLATTTPSSLLSVHGGALIAGTTTVQGLIATSSLIIQGTATSTFTNSGISVAGGGLLSTAGLTITGGSILNTSSASSTFTGGLRITTGGLTISTMTTCTAVETDASGNFLCGSDAGGTDADTLDTLDSLQFLRSDTNDNYTSGTLTFDSGTTLTMAAGSVFSSSIVGTSTWSGALGATGVSASNGFTLTGGSISSTGHLQLFSSATSTLKGSLSVATSTGGLTVGTSTLRGKASFDGEVTLAEFKIASCTGSITVNWSNGNKQVCVMTGNITGVTFVQGDPGTVYRLNMCQDTTGNRTIRGWGSGILFVTGDLSNSTSTPGHTTKISTCNIFTFDTSFGTSSLVYFGTLPLRTY